MNVRPAQVEDVPAVLPMVARICAFHERLDPLKYGFLPDPAEMYRDWLKSRAADPRSVFLVADAASTGEKPRLVAFLVGTVEREIPIYRLREFGFIHDTWVDEEYRHEGLARQLVALAVERFREIGVKQIRLDVLANNPAAQSLFAASGFRPSVAEMLMEI